MLWKWQFLLNRHQLWWQSLIFHKILNKIWNNEVVALQQCLTVNQPIAKLFQGTYHFIKLRFSHFFEISWQIKHDGLVDLVHLVQRVITKNSQKYPFMAPGDKVHWCKFLLRIWSPGAVQWHCCNTLYWLLTVQLENHDFLTLIQR
jgi:hypothetical protein